MTNEQRDQLLQDVHDAVTRIEERCRCCHEATEDLQATTYGVNGEGGLRGRVHELEVMLREARRGRAILLAVASIMSGSLATLIVRKLMETFTSRPARGGCSAPAAASAWRSPPRGTRAGSPSSARTGPPRNTPRVAGRRGWP